MVSILKKESDVFKKVPGGYFGIVGGLVFIVMLVISIHLFAIDTPINMFDKFLSDLGANGSDIFLAIGNNGSNIVFAIGVWVITVCLYPLVIHMCQLLWMSPDQKKAKWNNFFLGAGFFIAIFTLPGGFILTIFDMDPLTIGMHVLGGEMFFVGILMFGGAIWFSMEFHKQSTWPLRICSLAVVAFVAGFVLSAAALPFLYPGEVEKFNADPTGYLLAGGTESSHLIWLRFFEWLFVLAMIAWDVLLGYYAVKLAKKRRLAEGAVK
jgi:hypothetical protein